jgi:hypothetical protein
MKITLALLAIFLPLFAVSVEAANAWHERDLSWPAPVACADGDTDLTHCPVTGYKVEVAGSCTATSWNILATVGNVTNYHVTNLKPGSYCFRTRATNSGGDSDPAPTLPESKTVVTSPVPVKAGTPGATTVTP